MGIAQWTNERLEGDLLATALYDPKQTPGLLRDVDPLLFAGRPHRLLWRAMIAANAAGGIMGLETQALLLDQWMLQTDIRHLMPRGTLDGLISDYAMRPWDLETGRRLTPLAAESVVLALRTLALQRQAAEAIWRAHGRCETAGQDPLQILVDLQAQAAEILAQRPAESLAAAAEAVALEDGDAPVLGSWGIETLDRRVPLAAGRMIALAGAPGGGKTSLALHAAMASVACGYRPRIYSAEMSTRDLARRLRSRPDWSSAHATCIDAVSRRLTAEDACAEIRASAGRLIIIDHLHKLQAAGAGRTEYERLTIAARMISEAARDSGACVLLLCQMSREGRREGRDKAGVVQAQPEPRLADLKGSGAIEEEASAVVFLWLPERDQEDSPIREVAAKVAKNRWGGLCRTMMQFNAPQCTWSGVAPPPTPKRRAEFEGQPTEAEDLFR